MRNRYLWLVAVLTGLFAGSAAAQGRTLTGTVSDSATGKPLGGAILSVQGTRIGGYARDNGGFILTNVPDATVTLVVRYIGYKKVELRIPADQETVNVTLAKDIFKLEEIVVTGQATGVERRNLSTAIATVTASDLNAAPSASIEQQLQGRVAGADIQSNGGAPGGGLQVRMRGITSINAGAEPLYIVDGVIVSDIAIPSNQNAVTKAASGGNSSLNQDAQVNRIADLNSNDIEHIDILKGAAAAAIYGGRASNGVIIITTKHGLAGSPKFHLTQRFGFSELAREVGSRRFTDSADVASVYGPAVAATFVPGTYFDLEKQLAGRKSLGQETSASLSGGTEGTRYYASGQVLNEPGIIDNTGFKRQSLRINLDQKLGSRFNASMTTNFMHTLAMRGLTNNDNTGTSFYVVLSATPSFADLTRQPNGTFRNNPFVPSNPLQTAALMKNEEDVWRVIGTTRVEFNAVQNQHHSLKVSATGGLDFFSQDNSLFFPPELQFEPSDGEPGTSILGQADNLNLNLDGNIVHTYTPSSGKFTATTSAGIQYARRGLGLTRIVGRNLIGGQENVDAATDKQISRNRARIKNLGYFGQEEVLLLDSKLLLTAGIRADQSSLDADASKLYWYPKLSGSYRWLKPAGFLDELKFRVAYGESGNEPNYGQKFKPLDATSNIGGNAALVLKGSLGAPDLRPERQREIEGGFDAIFWRNRADLEFTVYQKNISDLLLPQQVYESSGYDTAFVNSGKLKTKGLELAAGVQAIQSPSFGWLSRVTFFTTSSRITQLPVPPFLTGGFGTSIGAFEIREGQSSTAIVGNDTLPGGAVVVRKVGDATPKFKMSFTNNFNFKRLSLSSVLDWQYGGSILNLTRLLYDFGSVTKDFADPIPGSTLTVGQKRLAGFQTVTSNYIESASFLKLREISLSYELSPSAVARLWRGIKGARFSLSARNIILSTPYSGLDPEVSNFGNQAIARNIDVTPFPPSRSFWFNIDFDF